ncbi:MAG: PDZ domain-containing protein [Pirellulaceae bacterium]|nr:PDZ domain-containing protein [Pirellulaceae bacterium]
MIPVRVFRFSRIPLALTCVAIVAVLLIASSGRADDGVRADDQTYRAAMADAVRNAANEFLPSVVTIEIIGAAAGGEGEVEQDAPTSGVIVDDDGYVVASSIVAGRPSAAILVVLPDRTRHAAKVVARDQHRDLVLLKIQTDKPLRAVTLPDKLDVQVGETTIAVGRYGADMSPMVSTGVLSAVERLEGIALQSDARVSAALYGGPLIDLHGNLLGVLIPAVAKGGAPDATSWYDSGIAFAVPADVVKQKLDRLKAGEEINRGLIGIVPKSDDAIKAGTELAAVRMRSPAEKNGLKAGDEIVAVAGRPVTRFQQIKQILGRYDAGETIKIEFKRGEKVDAVEIELVESIPPLQPQRLGVIASEASVQNSDADTADEQASSDEDTADEQVSSDDDTADEQSSSNGDTAGDDSDADDASGPQTDDGPEERIQLVVDAVVPGLPAEGALESGDVIVSVDGAEVTEVQALRRRMVSAEPDKPLKVVYQRDGKQAEVALTPATIAGDVVTDVPKAWTERSEKEWTISPLKLPDVGNTAAFVHPDDSEDLRQLGMLVLLLNPGDGTPEETLKSWPNLARDHGVVVVAVAPEADERWRPKEIDVVTRMAASVLKKLSIEESAVAVAAQGALAGGKAEAADSMVLAVAISASETFFGAAMSAQSRPPAVRLRENEADSSLQVLLPIKTEDDLPTWGTTLKKVGYPIVLGGDTDEATLLKWVRLLQMI